MKKMLLADVHFSIDDEKLEIYYPTTRESSNMAKEEARHLYEFLKMVFDEEKKNEFDRSNS